MNSNSVPLDVGHGECLDTVTRNGLPFGIFDIAKANIHELLEIDKMARFEPVEYTRSGRSCKPRCKSHRHPVKTATQTGLRRVDVGMGIDPQDSNFQSGVPFADGFGGCRDCTNSNQVIATQGQHKSSLSGVVVNSLVDLLRGCANGARPFHSIDVWVGVWDGDWIWVPSVLDGLGRWSCPISTGSRPKDPRRSMRPGHSARHLGAMWFGSVKRFQMQTRVKVIPLHMKTGPQRLPVGPDLSGTWGWRPCV